ncbi:MAG: hypothetical protein RJQ09_05835 [Cyclobacteriaceae bacterium]
MSDFIHYINLRDNDNYQVAYSSQVYGTFFSVYARFNKDENVNEDDLEEGQFAIASIDFKVINYRGLLDVGITAIKGPGVFAAALNDDHVKLFNIEVQAGLSNEKHEYNLPTDGLLMKKGEIMFIQRTLKRLHDRPDRDDRPLSAGIFDSEYFYREGINEQGDYEEAGPKPLGEMPSDLSEFEFGPRSGTHCPKAKIILM